MHSRDMKIWIILATVMYMIVHYSSTFFVDPQYQYPHSSLILAC